MFISIDAEKARGKITALRNLCQKVLNLIKGISEKSKANRIIFPLRGKRQCKRVHSQHFYSALHSRF